MKSHLHSHALNQNDAERDTTYITCPASIKAACLTLLVFLSFCWFAFDTRSTLLAPSQDSGVSLCGQAEPLYPADHDGLWEVMDEALRREDFVYRVADLLGGAVRIPTEGYDDMTGVGQDPRWEIFASFHEYLIQAFPQIHATLQLTKVNTHGLVYTWEGSDKSLKPILLTAHQDVVPVNPDTYDEWDHPPFSGYYDGTYIWGRGSVDDKSGLISLMTAIEMLLENNFQPRRGIVLAFGFDEEVSGQEGAHAIARYLLTTLGENAFVMLVDEGGEIEEQYGGIFALPAVTEKGYLDVRIDISAPGGHSSVPPSHTTIGILAELLVHYEDHPFESQFKRDTPMYLHAQCLAEHAPGLPTHLRDSIKESKTSDKALRRTQEELFQDSTFKALVGTTQAIDLVGGGVKSNALPENAMALVNHRIATDSSAADVREHTFGSNITDDSSTYGRLMLSDAWGSALEPAPITPSGPDALPFQLLAGTIRAAYASHSHKVAANHEIIVIPSLGSGNTDTQFYWNLTPHIFRYTHYYSGNTTIVGGIHTVNEACLADSLVEMVRFYVMLILNADEATLS